MGIEDIRRWGMVMVMGGLVAAVSGLGSNSALYLSRRPFSETEMQAKILFPNLC